MTDYTHLSEEERVRIYELRQAGLSITKIGKELDRPTSTVSRELKRNKSESGHYLPDTAQQKAKDRHKREKRLVRNEALRAYVIDQICSFGRTPEIVSGTLKNREKKLGYVCHETIYAWIYSKEGKKEKLWKNLKRHKTKRGLRKSRRAGVSMIPNRVSIHDRPAVINEKKRWGIGKAIL